MGVSCCWSRRQRDMLSGKDFLWALVTSGLFKTGLWSLLIVEEAVIT
jgi:hypothetical protein